MGIDLGRCMGIDLGQCMGIDLGQCMGIDLGQCRCVVYYALLESAEWISANLRIALKSIVRWYITRT